MNESKKYQKLIRKYHAGTLSKEELAEIQKRLAESEAFRREFLLYSQVEVTLADQVLFHNDMDQTIQEPPPKKTESVPEMALLPLPLQQFFFAK